MARTSFTPTSPPIVLSKQLTATLRCSIGPFSAVRRNGRTRRPAGRSQHPTRGGAATTNINRPNSPEVTDRKDVQPSFFSVASRFEEPTIIREERMMTNTANGICITQVATVFVPVADQKRALVFYLDKLGFEKRADFSYAEGSRWIEVARRARRSQLPWSRRAKVSRPAATRLIARSPRMISRLTTQPSAQEALTWTRRSRVRESAGRGSSRSRSLLRILCRRSSFSATLTGTAF